jgi:general secretion pathway protein D
VLTGRSIAFAPRPLAWVVGVILTALCASGCMQTASDLANLNRPAASDPIGSLDLRPRASLGGAGGPAAASGPSAPVAYYGAPNETTAGGDPVADGSGGYTLDFENTPIAAAAHAVLGDILKIGYVIDPRAQGTISLSSARPVAKKDVLFAFESALKASNLALLRDPVGYRIAPDGDKLAGGVDRADSKDGVEAGYGVTVVPAQFVAPDTLIKLMDGFSGKTGAVRSDPSGHMLLVVGSGVERQAAVETIRTFDVDWLRGQAVGIYPIHNGSPDAIIAELEKVMDSGDGGLSHDTVKLQAMGGQNAVLVVATRPELLRSAGRWIARLDNAPLGGATVKVYRLRYGDAKQIAELLTKTFGASGGATESAASQIAPGSGAAPLSSVDRLTGGAKLAAASASAPGASSDASAAASPFGALAAKFDATGGAEGGAAMRITPDIPNNAILIYAGEEMSRTIERAIIELDRPKLQVAIDVTIAEVTLNDELTYGVQFFFQNHYGSIGNSTGTASTINPALPGFNFIAGNSASPQVILSALHQYTTVKILSNPSLVVVDNQVATLEVGDQVPVSTGSATVLSSNNAVVNTIDYKNTGIILRVQPRVNSNGSVLLDVEQEISSIPNSSSSSSSTTSTLTPTISTRKVKSELSVADNQTVLLAGLISDQASNTSSGVPVLDQIPIVGSAFANKDKQDQRTELVLFIRPQIIRNGADAATVAEELRAKMRGNRPGPFGALPPGQ